MTKSFNIGSLFNQHDFINKVLKTNEPDTRFIFQGNYFTFGSKIEETLDALLEINKKFVCEFQASCAEEALLTLFGLKEHTYYWRKGWLNPYCGIVPVLINLGYSYEDIFYLENLDLKKTSVGIKLKCFLQKLILKNNSRNEDFNCQPTGEINYSVDSKSHNYSFNKNHILNLHNNLVNQLLCSSIVKTKEYNYYPIKKVTKKIISIDIPEIDLNFTFDSIESDFRSQNYSALKNTETIYLIYDHLSPEGFVPKILNTNFKIWEFAQKIFNTIHIIYGDGYVARAFFSKLIPNSKITSHFDVGWGFSRQHRFHFVVKTNDDVNFIIDNKRYKFLKNDIWEINNKLRHSVENNGHEDRVHFIFDYCVINENLGLFCNGFDHKSEDFKIYNYLYKINMV